MSIFPALKFSVFVTLSLGVPVAFTSIIYVKSLFLSEFDKRIIEGIYDGTKNL